MSNKYNILSLDPMYSSLHNEIASVFGREKTALVSCLSKKIYLTKYKTLLATYELSKIDRSQITSEIKRKISRLNSHHHSYVEKNKKRKLNDSELEYMSKYYLALRNLIIKKRIDLVILHNDLRWYHAIAIELCKELDVKYIVTEQGLIRPYTTVVDRKGANANSSLMSYEKRGVIKEKNKNAIKGVKVKGKHDSLNSIFMFMIFIFMFTIERSLGGKTILRYMHNNYSKKKYFKRLIGKIKVNKNKINYNNTNSDYALLLLQLESDTQMLVHSQFIKNIDVIREVERQTRKMGVKLLIKKHPLDQNKYDIGQDSEFIEGNVKKLSSKACLVITINSSAAIDVLRTSTPLFLLGNSIYNICGIGKFVPINKISEYFNVIESSDVDLQARQDFINMLENEYLLHGAGFDFPREILKRKIQSLIDD